MPYLNLYLENIDATENEVHILYWNRDLVEEALKRAGRTDLIGMGKNCLIKPRQPKNNYKGNSSNAGQKYNKRKPR